VFAGVDVEAGVGATYSCPSESHVSLSRTLGVVDAAVDANVNALPLATTMGMRYPVEVDETDAAAELIPETLSVRLSR